MFKRILLGIAILVAIRGTGDCGTLYYDRVTGEALSVSYDPMPVSTAATDVATAEVGYPLDVTDKRWVGGRLAPVTSAQVSARIVHAWKRELWALQAARAIAQSSPMATEEDKRLLDRDIEMARKKIRAVVER